MPSALRYFIQWHHWIWKVYIGMPGKPGSHNEKLQVLRDEVQRMIDVIDKEMSDGSSE